MVTPAGSAAKDGALARLRYPSGGAVEAMKVAGFGFMVCDHVNRIDLDFRAPLLSLAGRIALPLFAFVLAVNLRRHSADWSGYFTRLVMWGIATQPIYHWVSGRNELNILFTLAIGLQLVVAVEALAKAPPGAPQGPLLARLAIAMAASVAADYPVLGPLLVLVFHAWLDDPSPELSFLAVLLLAALNLDPAMALPALAAVPVALILAWWEPPLKRSKGWLFYALYPSHLAVLKLLA